MQISGKGMALDVDGGVRVDFVALNFIAIDDEDTEGQRGCGWEVQVPDQPSLHEVVRAPTVDEDHDGLVGDAAQHAQCFWGGLTRQRTKIDLGLGQVLGVWFFGARVRD